MKQQLKKEAEEKIKLLNDLINNQISKYKEKVKQNKLRSKISFENNYDYLYTIRKNFKSVYVKKYNQSDNIFDYFKHIQMEQDKGSLNNEQCKYIHLIIENPDNEKEMYELGLKVIDIKSNIN